MTATDLNAEVLDRLGRGDEVFVAEALKERAATLAEALGELRGLAFGSDPERQVKPALEPVDERAEKFLAILFPALEYAGRHVLDLLPRALLHIAGPTPLAGDMRRSPFSAVAIGRLAWAAAAYCVHCRRFEGLAALWAAVPAPLHGDDEPSPCLAYVSLRHNDVFERSAGRAFTDYRDWLRERALLAHYPLFVAELDEVFAEGDLLLALLAAAAGGREIYSAGFDATTVSRFRARLGDARQRVELATLFAVASAALDETLAEAYGCLRSNAHSFERPPQQLFSAS